MVFHYAAINRTLRGHRVTNFTLGIDIVLDRFRAAETEGALVERFGGMGVWANVHATVIPTKTLAHVFIDVLPQTPSEAPSPIENA